MELYDLGPAPIISPARPRNSERYIRELVVICRKTFSIVTVLYHDCANVCALERTRHMIIVRPELDCGLTASRIAMESDDWLEAVRAATVPHASGSRRCRDVHGINLKHPQTPIGFISLGVARRSSGRVS